MFREVMWLSPIEPANEQGASSSKSADLKHRSQLFLLDLNFFFNIVAKHSRLFEFVFVVKLVKYT